MSVPPEGAPGPDVLKPTRSSGPVGASASADLEIAPEVQIVRLDDSLGRILDRPDHARERGDRDLQRGRAVERRRVDRDPRPGEAGGRGRQMLYTCFNDGAGNYVDSNWRWFTCWRCGALNYM